METDTHRGLVHDEVGENVVADAGGPEGIQTHVGQAGLELHVHGADGCERGAHGVADHVQRRARVCGRHVAHSRRYVGLQAAVIVRHIESCNQQIASVVVGHIEACNGHSAAVIVGHIEACNQHPATVLTEPSLCVIAAQGLVPPLCRLDLFGY